MRCPCIFTGNYLEKPLSDYKFNAIKRKTNVMGDEHFQVNAEGKNMFIYCSMLDNCVVGKISTALLRFVQLKINMHIINFVEFENLFYYPLLYNDINELTTKAHNELGKEIQFNETKTTFLLHF